MSDVVFLLLIFLLITSNFATYTGIKVDIPKAQNVHTEIKKNITLTIDDKELIYVNDKLVDKTNLINYLKTEIANNPDIIIMIQADQKVALGKVVELIDYAKSAGSNKFFIAANLVRNN
jgi:biopolymer transport protein ExbD